jgi:hypothetical protein
MVGEGVGVSLLTVPAHATRRIDSEASGRKS